MARGTDEGEHKGKTRDLLGESDEKAPGGEKGYAQSPEPRLERWQRIKAEVRAVRDHVYLNTPSLISLSFLLVQNNLPWATHPSTAIPTSDSHEIPYSRPQSSSTRDNTKHTGRGRR